MFLKASLASFFISFIGRDFYCTSFKKGLLVFVTFFNIFDALIEEITHIFQENVLCEELLINLFIGNLKEVVGKSCFFL